MSIKLAPIWTVVEGECREVMRGLEAESFDSCVCDPPYEINFMGRSWDSAGVAFDPQTWSEVLRLLKPGGHLLAFGGTRTFHRIACAIEDAGFDIRNCAMWMYGSGFPKSLNISKAIDKAAGAEREVVGRRTDGRYAYKFEGTGNRPTGAPAGTDDAERIGGFVSDKALITAPATDNAKKWDGWGTDLKPFYEPIIVARKPLEKRSVASNVIAYGTGGINIDASRIGTSKGVPASVSRGDDGVSLSGSADNSLRRETGLENGHNPNVGRWPANVLMTHHEDCVVVGTTVVKGDNRDTGNGTRPGGFAQPGSENGDGEPNAPVYGDSEREVFDCHPECPVRLLDEQTLHLGRGGDLSGNEPPTQFSGPVYGDSGHRGEWQAYGDKGGASRFLYTSKVSRKERSHGLDEKCDHPTMKPIQLMRYLVKLVTPPGGVILDPFSGSGSTIIAATLEGFDSVGIEQDEKYVEVGRKRVAYWAENGAPK